MYMKFLNYTQTDKYFLKIFRGKIRKKTNCVFCFFTTNLAQKRYLRFDYQSYMSCPRLV